MFYFGEIAAIVLCWLFYCEYHWKIERQVVRTCRRKYIEERCKTIADRLFYTPVCVKARLGTAYYINMFSVIILAVFTVFHLSLGWLEPLENPIRVITTILVILLGANAAVNSTASTETICADNDIFSKKTIRLLQVLSFGADFFLILVYLYFAWAFVG